MRLPAVSRWTYGNENSPLPAGEGWEILADPQPVRGTLGRLNPAY